MSEQEKSEKTKEVLQRDIFAALNGRHPNSDQEFSEWITTDEVKRRRQAHSAAPGFTKEQPLRERNRATSI